MRQNGRPMRWGRSAARCVIILMLLLTPLSAIGAQTPATQPATIDLGQRLGQIHIVKQHGQQRVLLTQDGRKITLTPDQYINAVEHTQQAQRTNRLFVIFNITNWFGVVWVALGLLGQLLFTGRMIVQWLVSERSKRSVVPVAFWWMSIGGATMLLAYFIWRKDIVGVLGQCTGWGIYARNLWLIYKRGPETVAITSDPAPEAELGDG